MDSDGPSRPEPRTYHVYHEGSETVCTTVITAVAAVTGPRSQRPPDAAQRPDRPRRTERCLHRPERRDRRRRVRQVRRRRVRGAGVRRRSHRDRPAIGVVPIDGYDDRSSDYLPSGRITTAIGEPKRNRTGRRCLGTGVTGCVDDGDGVDAEPARNAASQSPPTSTRTTATKSPSTRRGEPATNDASMEARGRTRPSPATESDAARGTYTVGMYTDLYFDRLACSSSPGRRSRSNS